MTHEAAYLQELHSVLPRHMAPQANLLGFLAETHTRSAEIQGVSLPAQKLLARFGVKDNLIHTRRFECPDPFLLPQERTIYRIEKGRESGGDILERGRFFSGRAEEIFQEFYPSTGQLPDHIVHVTCTGYISPSAPQKLVAKSRKPVEVTHAYHMGCYAALPAIRIALGQALGLGKITDVVHTEMCSLHMNPDLHSPEQIVVQSLFADGHIRYRVSNERRGFRILKVQERVLPDSAADMEWIPAPWGMQMTLSREVPEKIRGAIREFVLELLSGTDLSLRQVLSSAPFAIHPGGPKVVESVKEALELSANQVSASETVLRERGNMSSATLPHVWQNLAQQGLPKNCPVVSLAFGPGLTVFGSIFEWIG